MTGHFTINKKLSITFFMLLKSENFLATQSGVMGSWFTVLLSRIQWAPRIIYTTRQKLLFQPNVLGRLKQLLKENCLEITER